MMLIAALLAGTFLPRVIARVRSRRDKKTLGRKRTA